MGGSVALHFARAHPERVSALIVADTGTGSEAGDEFIAGVRASAAALERYGLEPYTERALANPAFGSYAQQGAEAERFLRSCMLGNSARGLAHTARGVILRRPSLYSLGEPLRALSVPTLLIVGERDAACTDVHRFLAAAIPGARHVVIPGAGHLSNLEAPAAFDAALRDFLGDVAREANA
jgi:pimeloyl-ACP methyl ester carboxylesterase